MARRTVSGPDERRKVERATTPACSICEGMMVVAYDRYQQKVFVCTDCNTSISVPGSAWAVAAEKRAAQTFRGPERRRQDRRGSDTRMQ